MAKREERTHVTLFVPGTPPGLDAWRRALADHGLALKGARRRWYLPRGAPRLSGGALPFSAGAEWIENDGRFGQAFSMGPASPAEVRAIDAAPGALLLTLPVDLHRERAAIAALGRALGACGALAVRIEESKVGLPVERWVTLIDGADPWSLYRAAVMVLAGDGVAQTCGMHVFSLPDARVALDGGLDAAGANALLGTFNVYQLAEDPLLLTGHTFAPDAATPRRALQRWPDARYARGHVCHNPFGVWRLGPPGSAGEAPSDPAPVIMPALVVLLAGLERKAGRPLTRGEAEEAVRSAPAIAMDHRDARELERRRGYADIDPERAWEQWQIARRGE